MRKQLFLELAQLRQLLELYQPLIEQSQREDPSDYETGALAGMLQSFYNGVENLFRRTLRELGESEPQGKNWHQQLLEVMTNPAEDRPTVISDALHETLLEYLQFRHVFRSSYLFQVRWHKMAALALEVEKVFERLEAEMNAFITHMDAKNPIQDTR